jgi:hypothetical protein
MTLPLPNLDDRTYADLVEEARGLLIAHAPKLTNHNPSDPLITLTELFAYFTEIMVFRLNVVTDANRTAFLRLLNGPDWPVPITREALDAAVRETVLRVRSIDRAVSAEDFESLALRADPEGRIARARCVPNLDLEISDRVQRLVPRPGHVSVVIVPVQGADLAELIPVVASFLAPRCLLGTRLHVVGPRFVTFGVFLTLHLLPDAVAAVVHQRATAALTTYFDSFVGGDGGGWPFGRNVYVSDIYRLLDTLPGVDFVTRTLDPGSGLPNHELYFGSGFGSRAIPNGEGANVVTIGVRLDPGELPRFVIVPEDLTIEASSTVTSDP